MLFSSNNDLSPKAPTDTHTDTLTDGTGMAWADRSGRQVGQTTVTALIGAGLHAFDAFARPNLKFDSLLLAEARLESETFRFKTRTGEYRLLDSTGTKRDIRAIFAKNCQELFEHCVQSDFPHGSLKPCSLWPFWKKTKTKQFVVKRSRNSSGGASDGGAVAKGGHGFDSASLESTPTASYDLEAASSKESNSRKRISSKDMKQIDSALLSSSTKSNSSSFFAPSQRDLYSIQSLSYSDRCLSFDNYIAKRLHPVLQQAENDLPLFTFFKNFMHFITIGLIASCALLLVFDRIQWIPLAIAGAA